MADGQPQNYGDLMRAYQQNRQNQVNQAQYFSQTGNIVSNMGQLNQLMAQRQANLNAITGGGGVIWQSGMGTAANYQWLGGSRATTTGGFAMSPMSNGAGLTASPGGTALMSGAQGMGAQASGSAQFSPTDTSPVYMGMQGPRPGDPTGEPLYSNLGDVINSWYTMDRATKDKFEAQLAAAGYKTETMTDADLSKVWGSYAAQAAAYANAGKQITLWDLISMDQRTRATAKPVTTTNVSKSYNISNYEDTHAIFMNAAQSLLGRAPTVAETKAFQRQLNAYERANPSVTTTTQTTSGLGNSTSTSSTSGGVTAAAMQDMAQQAAQQNPEYGSYQAATTYFNSLLSAIGHM